MGQEVPDPATLKKTVSPRDSFLRIVKVLIIALIKNKKGQVLLSISHWVTLTISKNQMSSHRKKRRCYLTSKQMVRFTNQIIWIYVLDIVLNLFEGNKITKRPHLESSRCL